jgi:acyl-CoA thioester hydrolase
MRDHPPTGTGSSIMDDLPFGGVATDGAHRLPVRVYYEDTDFAGVVYHAGYLRFMERGRTEYLRAIGIEARTTADFAFVVRHMAIDFRAPARMDDLLAVETRVITTGGARIVMDQKVLRGMEALVTAAVTIAAVGVRGRPVRLPRRLRDLA